MRSIRPLAEDEHPAAFHRCHLMSTPITSLHHVTATVSDAQSDVDFYTRILGMRLVKKTVNFDNPEVYHFYYGDELGRPSTLMTTFPYAGKGVSEGVKGAGQITVTSLSVPPGSLDFWRERFRLLGIEAIKTKPRFGAHSIMVEDPSSLNIELVEGVGDEREPWMAEGIPRDAAVRGLFGVTFVVRQAPLSVRFATEVLGLSVVGKEGQRTRITAGGGGPGSFLEVLESARAPEGRNGLGTVHHVAMAVPTDEEQAGIRNRLGELGYKVTPVRDRQYFQSIYFREPGGILYEVATQGPGFTIDEDPAELGTGLRVPSWEEPNRATIEAALPPIETLSSTTGKD